MAGAWSSLQNFARGLLSPFLSGRRQLEHLSHQVDVLRREQRLLMSVLTLPPQEDWLHKIDANPGEPSAGAFPLSVVCRHEHFRQTYFPYWARRVGSHVAYHRKLWEHVFICQALWERAAIRPGSRGLGFGVGREPLAAVFAAHECDVLATDIASDAAKQLGWMQTTQHADGLETLRFDHICPPTLFEQHVGFAVCDMNRVPADLVDFDFCWSACALEHLGSIEKGLAFIERSLGCLKPGGWAVHTTEFNISSNDITLETESTVLFRRRDMEQIAERLRSQGHFVAEFDFDPGQTSLDRYIDVAPYRSEPHLKLAIEGFSCTSIGIIIQKAT